MRLEATTMTIEDKVFEAVKNGSTQGIYVRMALKKKGLEYTIEQVRGAMSRLKKYRKIEYKNGIWNACV
jgi:hypothetical protein